MKTIQILGSGCAKCEQLTKNAKEAADQLGIEYELSKVTDINEILSFGVMITPALVVDGEVKISGKLTSVEEIKTHLSV